jgi:uncharacterized protein DUF222/HNH endonuclease
MFDLQAGAHRLQAVLAAYPDDPSGLADEVATEGFAQLQRFSEALEAKRLRWLADQDRRASFRKDGYLSSPAWLSHRFRVGAGAAKAQVKVAQALGEMPEVRQSFSAGEVTTSAVIVLAEAKEAHPEAFASQEPALLEAAQTKGVEELRAVVREWSRAVDADQALREAERLRDRRRLDICATGSGTVRVEGELDPENGEAVLTALHGLVDAELRASGGRDMRTPTQRRADALGELCRRYLDRPDRPIVAGERPHLTVTVDVEALKGHVGTGQADHVGPIPSEMTRRLACDASLMRVVMAGPSEPLEVGRRTPVVSAGLRRAVVLRDERCRFPGCDRPHAWCDAHHVRHWADGGETNLANLVLLCRPHHRLLHEGGFGLRFADGKTVFRRPDGSEIADGRAPPLARRTS